ncbi:quinon protein alcohol dehydrogenase-like superfamily [Phyllosticta capitalensis]|uniref:quinon protein alcohol dehydrogenase-like superfamily n=1 Tax=Phyllosticta capitalensis TaxID=121624 RepID=UPI00312E5151
MSTSSSSPPLPVYILRGHAASIHAVRFIRRNSRLLTGDGDGWVILWNLASKRPAAVWRPHTAAILGLDCDADGDAIITHGRDAHLRVWQLRPQDEAALDTVLPVDDAEAHRKQPWLLHSLLVNTLNFCSFVSCAANKDFFAAAAPPADHPDADSSAVPDSTLVAVPGVVDGTVAVYGLPSERRIATVPKADDLKTGMVMALALVSSASTLHLIAGYENGMTAVFALDSRAAANASANANAWQRVYASHPHAQPLLSLCPLPPDAGVVGPLTYFSSGADDVVARHVVPVSSQSPPSTSPISSASMANTPPRTQSQATNPPSLLSAALASSYSSPSPSLPRPANAPSSPAPSSPPTQSSHTKHSGQQSLTIRSDGRLLATAGWDGRARLYSTRSLSEVAVLKWHQEGCYAVDFAEVLDGEVAVSGGAGREDDAGGETAGAGAGAGAGAVMRQSTARGGKGLARVRRRREERVQGARLVAVGSKDGKVSLWEVF